VSTHQVTDDVTAPLTGRVALVTGAARGQGRSHAVRLADDGASIIAIDVCARVGDTPYPPATRADLDRTGELVGATGSRVCLDVVDVRDLDALTSAVARAADELGGLDIVVANAGIAGGAPIELMDVATWQDMIDVNLTGVWNTVKAAVPVLRRTRQADPGRSGSIVLTSSANGGIKAPPNLSHYAAAKHGVVGLVRSLANELGPEGIRVNSIHPTAVDTDMIQNDFTYRLFRPELDAPGKADVEGLFRSFHSLPIPWIEPIDVSNAVAFLASDRARYITGVTLAVDGGLSAR
jgi:SDR family mycofactocin-dependent oxidoreductase